METLSSDRLIISEIIGQLVTNCQSLWNILQTSVNEKFTLIVDN